MILFDLDGTLWDASVQMNASWEQSFRELGLPYPGYETLRSNLGRQFIDVLREWVPDKTEEKRVSILKYCAEAEIVYLKDRPGVLFPGVLETLPVLRENYDLGIISNCEPNYIETFLEAMKLTDLFLDIECSGNTLLSKGKNIRLLLDRNGSPDAVYCGDTAGDLEAAQEAGIPFIHAAYGFGTVPESLPFVSSFPELITAVPSVL